MKAEDATEDDLDYLKWRRPRSSGGFAHDPKSWFENPRVLKPKGCYCGGHGNHHANLKKKNEYWFRLKRRAKKNISS